MKLLPETLMELISNNFAADEEYFFEDDDFIYKDCDEMLDKLCEKINSNYEEGCEIADGYAYAATFPLEESDDEI